MSAVIALQPLLTETEKSSKPAVNSELLSAISSETLSTDISNALGRLANALTQAQQWQEAERVARSIQDDETRADALENLAGALMQTGEKNQAQIIRQEAERAARTIEN